MKIAHAPVKIVRVPVKIAHALLRCLTILEIDPTSDWHIAQHQYCKPANMGSALILCGGLEMDFSGRMSPHGDIMTSQGDRAEVPIGQQGGAKKSRHRQVFLS